jgi:hypothetical protein
MMLRASIFLCMLFVWTVAPSLAEPLPDEAEIARGRKRSTTSTTLENFVCTIPAPLADASTYLFLSTGKRRHTEVDALRFDHDSFTSYTGRAAGTHAVEPRQINVARRSGRLTVHVNGISVLQRQSSAAVNLRCYHANGEELWVQKVGKYEFSDDFARESMTEGDEWEVVRGTWEVMSRKQFTASPNPFSCRASASNTTSAIAVAGYPFLSFMKMTAAIHFESAEETGIVFAYNGPEDYYRATIVRSSGGWMFAIKRVIGNDTELLTTRNIEPLPHTWYKFVVVLSPGSGVAAGLDDIVLVTHPEPATGFGRFGLFVANGSAMFDDAKASSPPNQPRRGGLVALAAKSTPYSEKGRHDNDARDDHLNRWAHDADAWQPGTVDVDGIRFLGYKFHIPLMSDFYIRRKDVDSERLLYLHPAPNQAPVVIRLRRGIRDIRRLGSKIIIGDIEQEVGTGPFTPGYYLTAPPDTPVFDVTTTSVKPASRNPGHYLSKVGLPPGQDGLNRGVHMRVARHLIQRKFQLPKLYAVAVRQDFFENATVDWMRISGDWSIAPRWQCTAKWGFYSGMGIDRVVQTSKDRFEGNQVHEFYFGMRDIFNRKFERRRYIRRDVNLSFMTDGHDLFSGYTIMFGGFDNKGTYLLRGREVVAYNAEFNFRDFEEFHNIDDLHLFWRRLRTECIDHRVKVFFDHEPVIDYHDTNLEQRPDGGHLSLWTVRNGIVYARLNSTAEAITDVPLTGSDIPVLPSSKWSSLDPELVRMSTGTDGRIRATNRFSGGTFALAYKLPRRVRIEQTPRLILNLNIPSGTCVNLHCTISGKTLILPLTAPIEESFRVLGPPVPAGWRPYSTKPLPHTNVLATPQESIDSQFEVDIFQAVRLRFPNLQDPILDGLIIGNTSHRNYLMAGLSGNVAGAWYEVGDVQFAK